MIVDNGLLFGPPCKYTYYKIHKIHINSRSDHTQQFASNVSLRGYATWYTSNMAVTGVDRMTSLPHHEFLTYVTLIISLGLFGSQLARNNSILTADFLVVVKLAKSMPNCPTYSIVCSHSSTFVYDRLLQ